MPSDVPSLNAAMKPLQIFYDSDGATLMKKLPIIVLGGLLTAAIAAVIYFFFQQQNIAWQLNQRDSTIAQLHATVTQLTRDAAGLRDQVTSLERRPDESAMADLEQQRVEADEQIRNLQETLQKETRQKTVLKAQITDLQARLAREKTAWEAQIDTVKQASVKKEAAIERLQKEIAALEKRPDENVIADCKKLNEGVKQKLSSLEESLQKEIARKQALAHQTVDLLSQLEKQTLENKQRMADLKRQLEEKTSMLTRLHDTMQQLQNQIVVQEADNAALKKELAVRLGQETAVEQQTAAVKATYAAMAAALRQQIQSKDAVIESYQEKLKVTFIGDIFFASGSTTIRPRGKQLLEKVCDALKSLKESQIQVVGHTDNIRIKDSYREKYPSNWELSGMRAASVVRFLQEHCPISPDRLEAVGQSFFRPVADNKTAQGRAKNRRVEILIVPQLSSRAPS
jgi:chemotaxis protein MotB